MGLSGRLAERKYHDTTSRCIEIPLRPLIYRLYQPVTGKVQDDQTICSRTKPYRAKALVFGE